MRWLLASRCLVSIAGTGSLGGPDGGCPEDPFDDVPDGAVLLPDGGL